MNTSKQEVKLNASIEDITEFLEDLQEKASKATRGVQAAITELGKNNEFRNLLITCEFDKARSGFTEVLMAIYPSDYALDVLTAVMRCDESFFDAQLRRFNPKLRKGLTLAKSSKGVK